MTKVITRTLFAFLLLAPILAYAQSAPLYVLGNATNSQVEATNSTTPRTAGARAADVVNVLDFGADPTDTNDSTAAINAAFAQVRLLTSAVATTAAKLVFPNGTYKTLGSINATSLRGLAVEIDGGGASIDCQATGLPCIDIFNSRWLRIRDLSVVGSATNTPTIGIQMGTITNSTQADNHTVSAVMVTGKFSVTAWYLRCTESSLFERISGYNSASGGFGLIEDGYNHWNPPSAFTTVTQPVDVAQSFNEDTFITADFRESSTTAAAGIWIGFANRHRFLRSYIGDGGGYGVEIFSEGGSAGVTMLDADIHIETTAVTDSFLITTLASGGTSGPNFQGLYYRDHSAQPSNSLFKADVNTSAIYVGDFRLDIGGMTATQVFDNPSIWTVGGEVSLPESATQWNAATSQVEMLVGATRAFGYYGTAPIVSQLPDSTARGGNARGSNAVDLQTTRTANGQVASGTDSVVTGGSANAASAQYSAVLGGFANFAIGQGSAVLGGQGNSISGVGSSSIGGLNENDRGRYSAACHSSGDINVGGDSQTCFMNLKGVATSTTPVVLLGNGSAPLSQTIVNIPASSAYTLTVALLAIDHTTVTNNYSWVLPQALLTRGTTIGTTAIALGTPTILSNGTVTGLSVALTADTTNGGITLTFTPPSGNTDTWDITAFVTSVEGL